MEAGLPLVSPSKPFSIAILSCIFTELVTYFLLWAFNLSFSLEMTYHITTTTDDVFSIPLLLLCNKPVSCFTPSKSHFWSLSQVLPLFLTPNYFFLHQNPSGFALFYSFGKGSTSLHIFRFA